MFYPVTITISLLSHRLDPNIDCRSTQGQKISIFFFLAEPFFATLATVNHCNILNLILQKDHWNLAMSCFAYSWDFVHINSGQRSTLQAASHLYVPNIF